MACLRTLAAVCALAACAAADVPAPLAERFPEAAIEPWRPAPAGAAAAAPAEAILLRTSMREPLIRCEAVPGTAGAAWRSMVASRCLATLRPGADAMAVRQAGLHVVRAIGERTLVLAVEPRDPAALPAVLAAAAACPAIAGAEPDWIVHGHADPPDDPSYPLQWSFEQPSDADIDAADAWRIGTGDASTLVGIIDSGIDQDHPDLLPNLWRNPGEMGIDARGRDKRSNGEDDDGNGFADDWRGWDFANDDNDPDDDRGHGTHCAGTIGAVGGNGIGIAGIAWHASMVGLKFLDADGRGTTADAIAAVRYAQAIGCQVTNNSWGGGPYSQALADAIDDAAAGGMVFVASAGNDAQDIDGAPVYPAAYPSSGIIAVASSTADDALSSFSNRGAVHVDIAAPGSSILSTIPGSYGTMSGTSMAAPHVSGACALLRSLSPGLTPVQLRQLLIASADAKPALAGTCVAGGRLNLGRAAAMATGPVLRASVGRIIDAAPGDGRAAPGEEIHLLLRVANAGLVAAGPGTAAWTALPAGWQADGGILPPVPAEGESAARAGPIRIPLGCPAGTYQLTLALAADGLAWSSTIQLEVAAAAVLSGSVRRASDATAIPGAIVQAVGDPAMWTTADAQGAWTLPATTLVGEVVAMAPGYGSATAATASGTDGIAIALPGTPLRISPFPIALTADGAAAARGSCTIANTDGAPHDWVWNEVGRPLPDPATSGLWHATTYRSRDGQAWYYGQESTRNYQTGAANSGDLAWTIGIPADAARLGFWSWRKAEAGSGFDVSLVQVAAVGSSAWTTLLQVTDTDGAWRRYTVDLAAYAGTTIQLRFRFDTRDGMSNAYEGWYVDGIQLDVAQAAAIPAIAPSVGSLAGGASSMAAAVATIGGMGYGAHLLASHLQVDGGRTLSVPLRIDIAPAAAAPVLASCRIDDAVGGDGDGYAEAGESLRWRCRIFNPGAADLAAATARVRFAGAIATAADVAIGALPAGGWADLDVPLALPAGIAAGMVATSLDVSAGALRWTLAADAWPIGPRLSIAVRVADAWSGDPLAGADVSCAGRSAMTGADGRAVLHGFQSAQVAVRASRAGWSDAVRAVAPGGPELAIALTRPVAQLAPSSFDLRIRSGATVDGILSVHARGTEALSWSLDLPPAPQPGYTSLAMDGGSATPPGFIDISANRIETGLTGDDVITGVLPIATGFPFFGQEQTQFRICSNGFILFGGASSTSFSDRQLPSTSAPPAMIAACWTDLALDGAAKVGYAAAGDRLVIQFDQVRRFGGSIRFSFQIALHRTGIIDVSYIGAPDPALSATVGLQDATRTRGITHAYRQAGAIAAGRTVRFLPHGGLVSCPGARQGIVAAGRTEVIPLRFGWPGLALGVHQTAIAVRTGDPLRPEIAVPVRIEVVGTAGNAAPSATAGSVAVAEDGAIDLLLGGSDPDGDALSIALAEPPRHGAWTSTGAVVRYAPAPDWNGTDALSFTVSDGAATSAAAAVAITVMAVPDPPEVPQTAPWRLLAGSSATAPGCSGARDADGDALTYTIADAPAWLSVAARTGILSASPGADVRGTFACRLGVADGSTAIMREQTIVVLAANGAAAEIADPAAAPGARFGAIVRRSAGHAAIAAPGRRGLVVISAGSSTPMLTATADGGEWPAAMALGDDRLAVIGIEADRRGMTLRRWMLRTGAWVEQPLLPMPAANAAIDVADAAWGDGASLGRLAIVASGSGGSRLHVFGPDGALAADRDLGGGAAPAVAWSGPDLLIIRPDADGGAIEIRRAPAYAVEQRLAPPAGAGGIGSCLAAEDGWAIAGTSLGAIILRHPSEPDAAWEIADLLRPGHAVGAVDIHRRRVAAADPAIGAVSFHLIRPGRPPLALSELDAPTGRLAARGLALGWADALLGDPAAQADAGSVRRCAVPLDRPPRSVEAAVAMDEDGVLITPLPALDADEDPLGWTMTSAPAMGQASITADGHLRYLPAADRNGGDSIVLRARDDLDQLAEWRLGIGVRPVPDALRIGGRRPPSVVRGGTYQATIAAEDPDGALVALAPISLPAWLRFDAAAGAVSGVAPGGSVGRHDLRIRASSADGENAAISWTLDVLDSGAPAAFTSTPPLSATVGRAYTYVPAASDPDLAGDLPISAVEIPAWLALRDGVLAGTPVAAGTSTVRLAAGEAAQSFAIAVARANRPPSAQAVTASALRGATAVIPLAATDPDGDALTYVLAGQPSAGSAQVAGGLLHWEVPPDAQGILIAQFAASDGELESPPAPVALRVESPPVPAAGAGAEGGSGGGCGLGGGFGLCGLVLALTGWSRRRR